MFSCCYFSGCLIVAVARKMFVVVDVVVLVFLAVLLLVIMEFVHTV